MTLQRAHKVTGLAPALGNKRVLVAGDGGAASNAGRGLAASLQRRVEGSSVGGSVIV